MDKNNWINQVLKLATIVIQAYIESSSKLHSIEIYFKKLVKYLITLTIVSIPILLTIWGGIFLSLFFYITAKFGLSNYVTVLIITIINILILIICLIWFKHKFRKNKLEKNNLSLLFMKLMHIGQSIDNE